jgi:hypothetical protein
MLETLRLNNLMARRAKRAPKIALAKNASYFENKDIY